MSAAARTWLVTVASLEPLCIVARSSANGRPLGASTTSDPPSAWATTIALHVPNVLSSMSATRALPPAWLSETSVAKGLSAPAAVSVSLPAWLS